MPKKKPDYDNSPVVGNRISQWEPCPLCGSSDAMAVYEKDSPAKHYQSWCFSCRGIQTAWTEAELYEIVAPEDAPRFHNVLAMNQPKKQDKAPDMTPDNSSHQTIKDIQLDFEYRDIKDWKITKAVCEEVGIGVKIEDFGDHLRRTIFQNYKNEVGQITAQKVRVQTLGCIKDSAGDPERDASGRRVWETNSEGEPKWEYTKSSKGKEIKCMWYGNVADTELFGMDRARRMTGKKIVLVEGEKDLAAFASVFDRIPVVSVKDGASGAVKDCKKFFQFLNGYDEIIVCGDNDEAGRQMSKDVAEMFPRKHKVMYLDKFKDIHEYFDAGAVDELKSCFFHAKRQVPQMVKPISELTHLLFEPDPPCYCEYPWPSFNDKLGGIHLGEVVGVLAHEKVGKCHGVDTPIRMYDYSIKKVQDIVAGDVVMGMGGQPRVVKNTVKGVGPLYRVDQSRGMSYVVNDVHLLAVKRKSDARIEFIEAKALAAKTFFQRNRGDYKGFREALDTSRLHQPVPLDPYLFGLWLGDGTSNKPQFTTKDAEVVNAFKEWANPRGLRVTPDKTGITYDIVGSSGVTNPFTQALRDLNVFGDKHVPDCYVDNHQEVLLQFLAGILDTDGWVRNSGTAIELAQKRKQICEAVLEIAHRLGFHAKMQQITKSCVYMGEKKTGTYYKVSIIGDVFKIPLRIARKRMVVDSVKPRTNYANSSLNLTELGVGAYYGFELEGEDKTYLLADGTVTHNTSFLRNVAYNVWKTTGDPVGIIFLEDVKKDLVNGMVSLQLGVNLNKKGVTVPDALLRQAADTLTQDDRIYFKAEGGPGEISALMDVIDWMIAVGCKVIFFDNVSTLIVGDTASDSERQGIDNLIVECRDRATASEVCIFVVQHLNRQGFPRGSHALPIFASTTLELIRDGDTDDEIAKNTTEVVCRGNRKYGYRGEVALLNYEHDTSYLTELNQNSILAYKEWKERVKEESKKRRD